jgi:hypothetical protein
MGNTVQRILKTAKEVGVFALLRGGDAPRSKLDKRDLAAFLCKAARLRALKTFFETFSRPRCLNKQGDEVPPESGCSLMLVCDGHERIK